MDNFTEKEALYILRHRKQYTDDEIDKAINKIKRINSHRLEYIKRYKNSFKNSVPKKKIEDKIKAYEKLIDDIRESERYSHEIPLYKHDIQVLQELLKE